MNPYEPPKTLPERPPAGRVQILKVRQRLTTWMIGGGLCTAIAIPAALLHGDAGFTLVLMGLSIVGLSSVGLLAIWLSQRFGKRRP